MKYYIVAGEPSGDLHASKLIEQIKIVNPNAKFRAWGGDLIKKQNIELDKHIKDLSFMGFVEVLLNIFTILRNFRECKINITDFNPDAIIFVDYPGFNLRMAKWAKKNGYKVLYFISPTVWAWDTKRVYTVKKYVDKMYVILPFEKEFYKKFDVDVEYFGNPIVETIKNYKKPEFDEFCKTNNLSGKPIVALLPGSRKQEITRMLPVMIKSAMSFNQFEFVVAGSNNVNKEVYEKIIQGYNIKVIYNQTYDILALSKAGVVTSGTATLEAALFNVPQVVCYKGGSISVFIAKMVAKVKYISLVNLILNKPAVKELIQKDFNNITLLKELNLLLLYNNYYSQTVKDYKTLLQILGDYKTYNRIAVHINNNIK